MILKQKSLAQIDSFDNSPHPIQPNQLAELERLRETGNYARLKGRLPVDWQSRNLFDEETIRLRLLVADVCDHHSDLDGMSNALEPYVEALKKIPFAVVDQLLARLAVFMSRKGDFAKSLEFARCGERIAHLRENTHLLPEVLQAQAEAFLSMGELDQAVTHFKKAVHFFFEDKRRYRRGIAFGRLGDALCRSGQVVEAATVLRQVTKVLLHSRDPGALASARANLAEVLIATGDHLGAFEQLRQVISLYQQTGHHKELITGLATIAYVLHRMERQREARLYLSRAFSTAKAFALTSISVLHEVTARIHLERGNLDDAAPSAEAALEIARESGTLIEVVKAKRTAGRLYLLQGRDRDAVVFLRSAVEDAARSHKLVELEVKGLLVLAAERTDPKWAVELLTTLQTEIRDLPLPDVNGIWAEARKQILTPGEEMFVISDDELLTLAEARSRMITWLWRRALLKAQGNTERAANILGVTAVYIRTIGHRIRKGLSPRSVKAQPSQKTAANTTEEQ